MISKYGSGTNGSVKTLPEDSQLIFQMYYGEQFSIGEIAQLLHMKRNTVKSKIHWAAGEHLRSRMGVGKRIAMTNSPLIDRKIEEAYGIIRERSEKKKDRVEKKVCADGG